LTDEFGIPLALTLSGANVHDIKMAKSLFLCLRIKRPNCRSVIQNALLDKGYDSDPLRKWLAGKGYAEHIPYKENRKRAKRIKMSGRRKARRWIVESAGSWLNRFRRLKIRYENKEGNYLAFVAFACAIIIFRRL